MTNKINARNIKENVSIVHLLSMLGYTPQKKSGKEHIYLSMLRESDTSPSFSVNDKLGCWYDHGLGAGGNIIDFGLLYWPGCSFQQVMEKIISTSGVEVSNNPPTHKSIRKRDVVKEPNYSILAIKDLGVNNAITGYLESRGIWLEAQGKLKEIYYYVEDEHFNRMQFFAAGWQNELGAWEVRSLNFKGCLGHKAISFIPGDPKRLAVFEGFINYLSWLAENPFANNSVLVLNSLALIQPGIEKAKAFTFVATYFDNDDSGKNATKSFKSALPQTKDCSVIYEGYNDYNDKLVAGNNSFEIER